MYCFETNDLKGQAIADRIEDNIFELPEADVIEVKHGHWIPHETMVRTPFARNYDCSVCGNSPVECGAYCNKCGAKMDGGKIK